MQMFRPKNGFIETIRKAENEKAENKSGNGSVPLSFSLLSSLSLSQHMQTRVIHPADQAKQVEERPQVRVDHKLGPGWASRLSQREQSA